MMFTTAHPVRRRLVGAAVLLGLVLGAPLIGFAAPAHAVPGAIAVSTVSPANSVGKSVTATCPAGLKVYGASGRIITGGGNVLITKMVPDAALGSVQVQGVENDPYASNWQVEATAICAPENGHSLRRVQVPSPANGTNVAPRSAFANCDTAAGEVLFGTGFELRNASGNVLIAEVEPTVALDQVEVEARIDNGFTGNFDVDAIAICGKPNGSVVQLTSQTSPFGTAASRPATTPVCPQGTVTGVGGKVTDNTDGILLDRFDVDATLTQARATARDNALVGTPYDVEAFAICAT